MPGCAPHSSKNSYKGFTQKLYEPELRRASAGPPRRVIVSPLRQQGGECGWVSPVRATISLGDITADGESVISIFRSIKFFLFEN